MSGIRLVILGSLLWVLVSCFSDDDASATAPAESSSSGETLACEAVQYGTVVWADDSSFYYLCDGAEWVLNWVSVLNSSSDAAVVTELSSSSSSTSGFDPCRFNFGAGWQDSHDVDTAYYKGVNYISVWLGDNYYFNQYFEGEMLDMALAVGATPMIYAYVIAEFDKELGYDDCDVDSVYNHCIYGAQTIRQYFTDSILYRYQQYVQGFRSYLLNNYDAVNPDTLQTIWLIEPDFYQYSVSGDSQETSYAQMGGGIPDSVMGVYFAQIVDTIKTYLPSAKIAIDVSPWIKDMAAWYANFDLSRVDYGSTSGGRTKAGSVYIRTGNKGTWANTSTILGKPLLADAGYDAGGAGTGHDTLWDKVVNLNARIADGVIGVTQMDAAADYPARLDTIRPQLNSITGFGCSSN